MSAPFVPQSKNLDHLGLVAGMYDDLGIGTLIDNLIPQDTTRRILSVGQAVKAMVLNGLGFVNQNLYLSPQFFATKPVDILIGPDVHAEHVNDDVLGRSLDQIFEFGATELFFKIAMQSTVRLGISPTFSHLDSTSFHLDGEYKTEETSAIKITHGYSRDHRPDLKQIVLNLIVENQAGIPMLMKICDGNTQDKTGFREVIQQHLEQLQGATHIDYLVADSALYTKETLQELDKYQVSWITRVPENIKEAKQAIAAYQSSKSDLLAEGYQFVLHQSEYAGIQQRWLVIHSSAAEKRCHHSVTKSFLLQSEKEYRAFSKLCKEQFACRQDAEKALNHFKKKQKLTSILDQGVLSEKGYSQPGRPKKASEPDRIYYVITGSLSTNPEDFYQNRQHKSCFIIATNQMDTSELPSNLVLSSRP